MKLPVQTSILAALGGHGVVNSVPGTNLIFFSYLIFFPGFHRCGKDSEGLVRRTGAGADPVVAWWRSRAAQGPRGCWELAAFPLLASLGNNRIASERKTSGRCTGLFEFTIYNLRSTMVSSPSTVQHQRTHCKHHQHHHWQDERRRGWILQRASHKR